MKLFRIILVFCALISIAHTCFAGPLRDWIAEKKASNHQDNLSEEDDSSMAKGGQQYASYE